MQNELGVLEISVAKRMLLKRHILDGITRGEISVVFRRWKRPTVRAGGTLRTQVGVLGIQAVTSVNERDISGDDARLAGYESLEDLLTDIAGPAGRKLYRIEVTYAGEDYRIALRSRDRLSDDDVEVIRKRLARYDRSSRRGAWTRETLELIASHPGTLAADLAVMAGHEKAWFKSNVRKLKELGLTESLKVGYRLSPRGRAALEHLFGSGRRRN